MQIVCMRPVKILSCAALRAAQYVRYICITVGKRTDAGKRTVQYRRYRSRAQPGLFLRCVLLAVCARGTAHVRNAALAQRFLQHRFNAILLHNGRDVPVQRVAERDRCGVNGIDPCLTDHEPEAFDVLFQLVRHFDDAQIGERARLQPLAVDGRSGLQDHVFQSARHHAEYRHIGLSDVRLDVVDQLLQIRSAVELLLHFLQYLLDALARFLRRHARHKVQRKVSQRVREEAVAHVQRDLDLDRLSALLRLGAGGQRLGIDRGQILRDADVMRRRAFFQLVDRQLKRRQAQRSRCLCVVVLIGRRLAAAAAFPVAAEKHVEEAVADLVDLQLRFGRKDIVLCGDRFPLDAVILRDDVFKHDGRAVTVRHGMKQLEADTVVPIRDAHDRLRFVADVEHFAQLIRLLDQEVRRLLKRRQPVLQKALGQRDEVIREPLPDAIHRLQQRLVVDGLIQTRFHAESLRPGFRRDIRIQDTAGVQRQGIQGLFDFHISRQKCRCTSIDNTVKQSFAKRICFIQTDKNST